MAQGKLLLHGPLLCTDDPTSGPNYKLKEMTVFLFEQIMIFAETVGKKTQFTSPVYVYKAHIQVKLKNLVLICVLKINAIPKYLVILRKILFLSSTSRETNTQEGLRF